MTYTNYTKLQIRVRKKKGTKCKELQGGVWGEVSAEELVDLICNIVSSHCHVWLGRHNLH